MTIEERQKLFKIRCRAMRGEEFHPQDYDFCREMLRLHPKEYNAMTKELMMGIEGSENRGGPVCNIYD